MTQIQSIPPAKALQRLSTSDALVAPLDRRVHLRALRSERLLVQTRDVARRTLKCHTADVSPGGLQLVVSHYMAKGTILELWIKLTGAKRNHYLLATVRWCGADEGGFRLGVRVQDGPATDFKAWRKLCFL